jgi:hypothetical protein
MSMFEQRIRCRLRLKRRIAAWLFLMSGRKHPYIMPMPFQTIRERLAPGHLPLCVGLGVYALLLFAGNRLLVDPDTFWQIAIGKWIVDHRAVPTVDFYTFTMTGQPWMSTQWLAQALYGQADAFGGWTGVVILTALPIALTFALLARFIERRIGGIAAILLVPLSFAIALPHLLARPHAFALPVMVAWVGALLSADERRVAPSFWLVALMTLWANLHGSFLLGLMLIAPIALDAVVSARRTQRKALVVRWFLFGVAALAASCVTPYGWNSFLGAQRILSLGEALSLIREWAPANFARFDILEASILIGLGLALVLKISFPPVRIIILVGLLHMAFAHVRNADVFALLTPMVMAAPLAARFKNLANAKVTATPRLGVMALCAGLAVIVTVVIVPFRTYEPDEWQSPSAAVSLLKLYGAKRVFNDYDFGGYLISRGVPTYIDGRAELFGEKFVVEHNKASSLAEPLKFFELLDQYKIDATILRRGTAGGKLLDRMPDWQQVYADDISVVHIRKPDAAKPAPSQK